MPTAVVWLVLLLIGVGFPAAAWAVGRRLKTPVPPEDAYGFSQRHCLSSADAARLERALRTGTRLSDASLRPLVVERASSLLEQVDQRWSALRRLWRPTSPGGVLGIVLVLGAVVGLAVAAVDVLRTRDDPLPLIYVVAYGPGILLTRRLQARRLQRARARNQDDVEQAPDTSSAMT